jgi:hypothetical protein
MTKSERIQIWLTVLAIFAAVILGMPAWLTWLKIEPKDIAEMTYFEIVKVFINKYWWAYWLLSYYFIVQYGNFMESISIVNIEIQNKNIYGE